MASEGKEYDIEEDSSLGIDIKEKMAKQRQLLNARLGLDVVANIGIDMSNLFTNEDFNVQTDNQDTQNKCDFNNKVKYLCNFNMLLKCSYFLQKHLSDYISTVKEGLSSREMNRAKRKAKARNSINKQRSKEPPEDGTNEEPEKKKFKSEDLKLKDEALYPGI